VSCPNVPSPFWTHLKVANSSKVQCAGPFSADTGPALLQAKKVPEFILREGGFWMHLPIYLPTYLPTLLTTGCQWSCSGVFALKNFLPIL
jgi:hypothetical protein